MQTRKRFSNLGPARRGVVPANGMAYLSSVSARGLTFQPACLTGRTRTLGGVEYHELADPTGYWTPWACGRLIPSAEFEERCRRERR